MIPVFQSTLAAVLILLASNATAQADQAPPSITWETGQLKCGDALLTAKARCLVFPENETQCTSQALRLNNDKKGIFKLLSHDGKLITQDFVKEGPVLDAHVTSWACLTSRTGKSYLYLFYTCVENDKRPKCVGTNREWDRLFDTDGNNLTAGYRQTGRQIDRLMDRLGLGRYLREGTKLRGVTESPPTDAPEAVHK